MTVALAGLGADFQLKGLDEGDTAQATNFTELVIKAQTNQPAATNLRVVLATRDAVAYEAIVPQARVRRGCS